MRQWFNVSRNQYVKGGANSNFLPHLPFLIIQVILSSHNLHGGQ